MNEILLGDAYELIKQVPDKSVDLIVTDPPYLLEGWHVGTGLFKDRVNGYVENMMNQKDNLTEGFDISILDEFVRVMKGINIYLWCNKEQIYDYLTYFVKERKCRFEIIVWAKANPSPFLNGHYLKDKEYCLFFWDDSIKVHPKYENGKTFYHTSVNMSDKRKYGHPTIKPSEIIRNLILNSSEEGGVVLDPFSGSGTTCAVAKSLGRQYLGFEINPKWHKVSVDRLEGITQEERKSGSSQGTLF